MNRADRAFLLRGALIAMALAFLVLLAAAAVHTAPVTGAP